MADYIWPSDLVPYAVGFYLQPHTGGSESPFSRKTKVYGLSAPRWVCSMQFRAPDSDDRWGGAYGTWGERLDAFLAQLEGRANRVMLWDFRRPGRLSGIGNLAAAAGATTITLTDAVDQIRVGEYVGGDGRPHIITKLSTSGTSLIATIKPALETAIAADSIYLQNVAGYFRLTSDDAGQNGSEVGQLANYSLEFVEDNADPLSGWAPTVYNLSSGTTPTYTLDEVADGAQISNALFNSELLFSTGIDTEAQARTRIVLTAKPTAITSSLRVGLGIRNASGDYTALAWQNNGFITAHSNWVGGPTGILVSTAPSFVAGDSLRLQYDVADDGGMYLTIQKNGTGTRIAVGALGVPLGEAFIYFFDDSAAAVAAFRLQQQPVGEVAVSTSIPSVPSGYTLRSPPSGFTAPRLPSWFEVYKDPSSRMFFTTVDLQPLLSEEDSTVFIQHVDIATGNDANAGTSSAPLKSLNAALLRAAVDSRAIIKAKGGTYDFLNCCKSTASASAVLQLVSSDGNPVISSMHDAGLVWTLGVTSTYHATFTETVLNVFDALHLTSDGDYSILTLAASQAACEAAAGTYFVTGTTIYVHASDGRAPDSNIRVFKKLASGFGDNNANLTKANGQRYFENIHFEGGVYAFYAELTNPATTMNVYGKDCSFKYSLSSSPIVNGDILAIWQNCIAAWNRVDGFHYNPLFGSASATGIEVDCIGRWNGTAGGGVNNNSSNHGGPTIRVKTVAAWGDYHHAEHRGIHDILDGTNSRSWHLGITSRDSRNGYANFAAGLGSGAELMWNDTVTSSGATFDQEAAAGATVKDYDLVRSATDTGAGTITAYVP